MGELAQQKCVHNDSQTRSSAIKATKVGIREFRADLTEYIVASSPVAATGLMARKRTFSTGSPREHDGQYAEIAAVAAG